ncbi:MAG: sodium/proline symporter [Clostridia bacterium]|nr:sodium/proline symporter [Clostridia bacterium]
MFNTPTVCIMITIIVYLVGMLLIGVYFTKKNNSTSNFYLGGRSLGPLVTAMSAEASDMSGYLLMGLPGLAYLSGLADVGWTIIGLAAGTYLNWLLTSRRLRRYTQLVDAITIPEFFSKRFHDKKNILSAISAVIIIIFFIPYTASGFAACGKLFASLFGVNYFTAMIVSAVVIVGYTAAGGFLAASITDFIQSIIMTAAIFAILIFATMTAGGVGAVGENVKSMSGFLSMTNSYVPDTETSIPYNILHIITTVSWGLGYFGMPHILLRFMAINDEKNLKLSRRVASVWVVIAMFVAVCIGVSGRALSNLGIVDTLSGSDTETIIIKISHLLSEYGIIPALIAGLVLSGILASTMSTADSQLLAAASSVSQNIMQEKLKLKLTEKQSMIAARITVIAIAVLGVVIARDPDSSVFGIVSFAWAGFGASFGPIVICSLFWKRTTLSGALCGMAAGGAMVFIWKYLIKPMGGIFGVYELLPAFIVSIAVIVVVSLVSKKPSDEIVSEFEQAK